MTGFVEYNPTIDNYWRSIILFGRNVASYKFALAQSLLEFQGRGNDLITLEELALPFGKHMCRHLELCDKQATSQSSKFLDHCRAYNRGEINQEKLVGETAKLGFKNVIDAFHVVNQAPIENRFFLDERKTHKGIRLTENLFHLFEVFQFSSLEQEVEARWRLVETAWDLNISKNLVAINYDKDKNELFTMRKMRRINVTSCRDALNGYQKGHCFYCWAPISVQVGNEALADVDHFFPDVLKHHIPDIPINGVWNLVLACSNCNRGEKGKFAKIPVLKLLERLEQRNNYLIASHHPLRETLIAQMGQTQQERRVFLQEIYYHAVAALIHQWQPE